MDFELFNVKIGKYESEIVNYKYVYHITSVKETIDDNPNIFVENGGDWVFTPKEKTTLPDFSQDKSWIEIKNKMGIELTKEEKKILEEK